MRILTCSNSGIPRLLTHFETFSAALTPSLPSALGQFLRMALALVRADRATASEARFSREAVMKAPRPAPVQVWHLIAERMGLQRAEIFSSTRSHAIPPSPEGHGKCRP
jgi:hypothetical protein